MRERSTMGNAPKKILLRLSGVENAATLQSSQAHTGGSFT